MIRALRPDDDRTRFRSGQPDLDRFFQRYAGQNQFRHHVGVTYVAVEGDAIAGFVTVAAAHVETTAMVRKLAKSLPQYPLPVLRVARLAVAAESQGQGVGVQFVRFALALAHDMAAKVGCVGVVVDAKAAAMPFYERLGFRVVEVVAGDLEDRPRTVPMFLALGSVAGCGSQTRGLARHRGTGG